MCAFAAYNASLSARAGRSLILAIAYETRVVVGFCALSGSLCVLMRYLRKPIARRERMNRTRWLITIALGLAPMLASMAVQRPGASVNFSLAASFEFDIQCGRQVGRWQVECELVQHQQHQFVLQ